jgi:hypothetical protein
VVVLSESRFRLSKKLVDDAIHMWLKGQDTGHNVVLRGRLLLFCIRVHLAEKIVDNLAVHQRAADMVHITLGRELTAIISPLSETWEHPPFSTRP